MILGAILGGGLAICRFLWYHSLRLIIPPGHMPWWDGLTTDPINPRKLRHQPSQRYPKDSRGHVYHHRLVLISSRLSNYIHKNTKRHTAHTIVSWHNPKQWVIVIIKGGIKLILHAIKGLRVNMGKTKVLISGPGSMCFRSLAKTPVAWVSRASAQIPFSGVVVPVGSTRNAVVSLTFWSLMPAAGINVALDKPDQ